MARQIRAAQRAWGVTRVFLATDSPSPELFEDVLRSEHGLAFDRYTKAEAGLPDEYALPVDTLLCATAPYFLGNVPSTVTATIVQERDNLGRGRDTADFFGFGAREREQFRAGWTPQRASSLWEPLCASS